MTRRESWLPASPESAAIARALVRECAREIDLGNGALWELTLATTEAVANAVEHGGACGPNREILLRIECADDTLHVEVCDCGAFRDPRASIRDITRGRGLPIIAAVTDHMEVLPAGGRTLVRFAKRASAAAA